MHASEGIMAAPVLVYRCQCLDIVAERRCRNLKKNVSSLQISDVFESYVFL